MTGRLIGHVGLSPLFDTVEVGFGIATSEQRKGYATEGVARVCAWGSERFSLPAIVGVTDEANVASQGVLIRCGFSRKEEKLMCCQGVDRPVVVFELAKKEPNQSAAANRRRVGKSDGSLEFARDLLQPTGRFRRRSLSLGLRSFTVPQRKRLALSLLRNRVLAAKDILLHLARGCFWQLGLSATLNR